jgi:ferredoxin
MSDRRVFVDVELCESHGVCMSVAPDVFELDDDGVLHVLNVEPPSDLWGDIERAANSCPRMAISVVVG